MLLYKYNRQYNIYVYIAIVQMAKLELREKSRELRRFGMSIREIAHSVGVAKSTISLWCRDIELTQAQVAKLLENKLKLGQLMGAMAQKQKRINKISKCQKEGLRIFKNISKKEYFVAGLMLYLAEGAKLNRRIDFTNSDPQIIKFILYWLRVFFRVAPEEICIAILINQNHRPRDPVIKDYWSQYLSIPVNQFRSTIFLKSKRKKTYENHDSYYGTVKVRVLKSSGLCYRILGLIHGFMASANARMLA